MNLQNLPCPICGEADYSWGKLQADELRFLADNSAFFSKFFSINYQLRARLCESCGNVQVFEDLPEN